MIDHSLSSIVTYERKAISMVFSVRKYAAAFMILSTAISAVYVLLLPSLPEGGVNFYAVRFITPLQAVFSVVFGSLISLVIVLNAFAFRIQAPSTQKLTLGAVAASLVNGLCCTPIILSLIAFTGAQLPSSSSIVHLYRRSLNTTTHTSICFPLHSCRFSTLHFEKHFAVWEDSGWEVNAAYVRGSSLRMTLSFIIGEISIRGAAALGEGAVV